MTDTTLDVELADAFATAQVSVATSRAAKTKPEFYLDVVVKSGLDVSVADAITAGDLERTIEGASTLTLTLHDPHRALLRNPDLAKAIDMSFAGYWWRLAKVAKSGDTLTLTFEDRDVAYLRQHVRPRKAFRGKVTRAEFIHQLVREVGVRHSKKKPRRIIAAQRIRFVCPELHKRQPIAVGKTPTRRTKKGRDDNKHAGLNRHANLTVKGAPASPEQLRNGERVLDVADQLGAGPKATKALMEAVIVESQIKNLNHGDRDSLGILQVRVSTSGSATRSRNIEWCVTKFLRDGFYHDPVMGAGGAITKARKFKSSAGRVAQAVQGSGVPGAYDQWSAEADKWIDAYGGASGSDTGGTTKGDSSRGKKKYAFRRGEPGKREDSWTAIQRLAEEVQWRAFMDRGRLYYVSDNYLMRQKPRYVIDEDDDGIDEINFDIDSGKVSSDVTVVAHAKTYQVPAGSVMQIRKCGIANGRYLVKSVRQSIYDHNCEITLTAPTPKLAEPEAEDKQAHGAQGGDGTTVTGSSLRDKIVSVAKASAANYRKNPNAWHYSTTGQIINQDPTKPPKSGTRSDCSLWVMDVYKKAGAPKPPGSSWTGYTGTMRANGHGVPLSDAKPGDVILYGPAPSHHVELFVGPGRATIGHGSAPVDAGTVGMMADPHCWRYDFLD